MDFRKLLSQITLLEAITMADIRAAVGQETDEQKRAAILNDIAWKNNLPGLYDPVSGYFVAKQSMPSGEGGGRYNIAATARESDTQALAKMGLVPQTAKTTALGGLVGTGSLFGSSSDNAKAAQSVKDTSNKFNADATSKDVNGKNVAKLNDLVAKLTGNPTASDKIGADADAYNAAKAGTVQQGAQKVQQGAQKAAPKLPDSARPWDSQVKESLQRKMSSLLNEEFGIGERVVGGEETPPGINRLTGKPNEPQAAPMAAEPAPAVVPLGKRFDPRFKNGPEPYTIDIGGVVYKFAGRDKAAPGGGEVIKVPAAVIGIRGLGAVSVELGKDGLYYPAPQQESVAESMSALRDLLSQLDEGPVGRYLGKEGDKMIANQTGKQLSTTAGKSIDDVIDVEARWITDPSMKEKLKQWMAANPGKTVGAGVAALGLGAAGLDGSGRKTTATDPRVAAGGKETPAPSKSDWTTSPPAQGAQPAATASPAARAMDSGKPSAAPAAGGTGWKQIYDMNKDVIGSNPNIIKPGQQLKMPDGSTYTVKPGDNLSRIAKGAGAAKPDEKKSDEKKSDTPITPTGPTPEQAEIIKQIQATMMDLQGNDDDPVISKALSNAQRAIDSVGNASGAKDVNAGSQQDQMLAQQNAGM